MELVNKDARKGSEYGLIAGSRSSFCTKRIVAAVVAVTLLIVVIVTFVCTWGSSSSGSKDAWANLPDLEWEEDCPVVAPECPKSYQGLPPPLLLISLDGFRADYLSLSDAVPTLQKLARCGVRAQFLGSVYPTKTFPNHYTQVTGLYPAYHGIVDNTMYDPDTDRDFRVGQPGILDPEWWQREPVWVSAEKQGKRTATFFWPGADVRINETRPTYYRNYSKKVPFESRVVQILEWLDLPAPLRPSFLTLYFDEPDSASHEHGIHSKQVESALARVDRMVEGLFAGLQARNLTGCVNVLITSDHGMADIDCERVVDLREYINVSDVRANVGAFGRLGPIDNKTSVSELTSSLRCRNPHLRVFLKESLPVRMHYWENSRIEPVIVDTDSGWTIFKFDYAHGHKYCTGATHGYDNYFPDMRALFMAFGPSMKKNVTVDPFLNVELYELMCELIGIVPNPNNGTRGSLHHLLRKPLRPLTPRAANITNPPTAEVAKDSKEYAKRVAAAQCPCKQSNPQVDVPEDAHHLPFGIPSSSSTASVLLVRNSDYVLGYDEKTHSAQWAAFTLNATEHRATHLAFDEVCWRGDARVVTGVGCKDPLRENGFIQWPLYPPIFSGASTKEEASYVTNSVPVSAEYAAVLAEELWNWLRNETASGELHVITGPAHATPRHRDVKHLSVPSHLFVIAVSCSEDHSSIADCPTSRLQVDAFLLPNYPYTDNCEAAERVIKRNAARVVDIEGATGLEFFPKLPQYDAIRLRTALPAMLTRHRMTA